MTGRFLEGAAGSKAGERIDRVPASRRLQARPGREHGSPPRSPMRAERPLPPGQRDIGFFPRFGVPDFAAFIPKAGEVSLQLGGNLSRPTTVRLADLQKASPPRCKLGGR